MFGTHDLWIFVLSGLLLNITPGPDTLYIVGRSSTLGARAGTVAALGIGCGALLHVCAAALGLSAILAASAAGFAAVKIAGALYLLYVGINLIIGATPAPGAPAGYRERPISMRGIFFQGFLTNVLNPKVALFFLAFLPQFVARQTHDKASAFLFLGILFDVNGTLWNLLVAWSTARISTRLPSSAALKRWIDRCVGGIFLLVGVRLAASFAR